MNLISEEGNFVLNMFRGSMTSYLLERYVGPSIVHLLPLCLFEGCVLHFSTKFGCGYVYVNPTFYFIFASPFASAEQRGDSGQPPRWHLYRGGNFELQMYFDYTNRGAHIYIYIWPRAAIPLLCH